MRERFRRFWAIVLSILIIFQIPAGDGSSIGDELRKAVAAEMPAYTINLGTGVLQTEDGYQWSANQGDTVYYGQGVAVANSGGMSYRVLKNDGKAMLLDCAQTYKYENHLNNYSAFGTWEGSTPQEDMNSETENKLLLESEELSKVLNTTHPEESYTAKDGSVYTSPAGTDKVFMLSAQEAETYYADAADRAKGGAYWLRSNYNDKELTDANVYVTQSGQIEKTTSGAYAASPAFRINSSKSGVLFTSTLTGKNDELKQPEQVPDNHEWALTVLTNGMIDVSDEEVTVNAEEISGDNTEPAGAGVSVAWTAGATVNDFDLTYESAEYSILITDKSYTASDAKIKWYGRISTVAAGDVSPVSFQLPTDYKTTDHVYILAEKDFKNNKDETYLSHATRPQEIDLGISQVTVDSENTHLVTTDKEEQICYPKAGYQAEFEAVYTVEDGYYIPEDYSVEKQAGIQVTRLSSTQVKVSGTPTAPVADIKLEAATGKGEQAAPKNLKAEYVTGGTAKIVGTTEKMEYREEVKPETDAEWQPCSEGETAVERGRTYLVRYMANDSKQSGKTVRVEIKDATVLVVANPSGSHLRWEKSSGQERQLIETDAAAQDILYKAEDGYYIPEDYQLTVPEKQAGIQVTRLSSTQVKVSGTPTAPVADIKLEAATGKGEQAAPKNLKAEYVTGGTAKIVGTTEKMEYREEVKPETDAEWQPCSEGETAVERGRTYLVRYMANDSKQSGKTVRVEIKDATVLVVANPSGSHLRWEKSSGQERQLIETDAAAQDILYKAEDGYYIPEDYQLTVPETVTVIREDAETLRIRAERLPEDAEVVLNAATERQAGTGSVVQTDYYYGGTALAPELKSDTNGIEDAVIEYKKASEPDSAYTAEVPVQVGSYVIRATFPAVGKYKQVVAVSEFRIQYLPAPEQAYTITGTQGENRYYTSNVSIIPAEGYLIADALDGEYAEALILTRNTEAGNIYLKKQATGEKTDGIAMDAVLIDREAPVIAAVKDGETYYRDSVKVVVSDKNLSRIQINDENIVVKGTEMTLTLSSNHGSEDYQIVTRDVAGNETKASLTVAASWMKKGIIPTGELIRLKSDRAYSFGDGIWQVEGDTTSYAGGRSFYVKRDGDYTFTKKN